MSLRRCVGITSVVVGLVIVGAAQADVSVEGLFSDHMVLQRDAALPIWGTARPDEQVTVTLGERSASVKTDSAGRWQVRLDPLPAGGPMTMTIAGENTLTIHDVLIGEVWVCSGQSNMAWVVHDSLNFEQELAAANHPRIRLLRIQRRPEDEPQTSVQETWQVCSPETVEKFSAVGYFFGRDLSKAMNVPIGLISSCVGGTPAEAWTPKPVLEADADLRPVFDRWEKLAATMRKAAKRAEEKQAASRPNRAQGRAAARRAPRRTEMILEQHKPAVLYNGMIHPLIPYAIRGAIWYQGEGNSGHAYEYRKLFPAMIRSWRKLWGEGDFPFLFVQLASYQASQKEPYQSAWAELREAQLMTLSLPKTAMAVTTDIGDPKNIHPRNKQEVGRRLALAARGTVYGEKIPYSGPLYDSMASDGGKIRLRFTHTDGGLATRGGGPLKGFAVAGDDHKFVPAEAAIDGDTVVVHSEQVAKPVAVRYAWADVPDDNLVNGAGLPASPFRTDDWPGVTQDAH